MSIMRQLSSEADCYGSNASTRQRSLPITEPAHVGCMQGGVGGKLHVFLSCLSKVGSNALTVRDTGSNQSEKEPMKTMLPASTEYRKIGEQAAERMVRTIDASYLGCCRSRDWHTDQKRTCLAQFRPIALYHVQS